MKPRDYQQDIFEQLTSGTSNDLVQLDTGAGKTPIEAALARWAGHSMVVAHRVTLIEQISEKLAAFGLLHDTVSTEYTRRRCMARHRVHRRNYIQRGHATRLAVSIDSLHAQLKRGACAHIDRAAPWLIIIDEAHHVVPDNKWGIVRELFPNARIVGFTATPARMDGESLHVSKGGLFDRLVQASMLKNDSARVLIERGALSDFVVYAPPAGQPVVYYERAEQLARAVIDDMLAEASASPHAPASAPRGLDYMTGELLLYADPVQEYRRRAAGTQAIVMAPAIKNAEQFAEAFRAAGIPAGAIHSKQSQSQITRTLEAFASGRLRVICNVDMIGEGFDMPSVETLIIATLTKSFPRFRQWVGRVLRPATGKTRAIIIDLTRQVEAHGMPDDPVEWDLINPPCGPQYPLGIPCDDCGAYYKMRLRNCPHCGAENAWLKTGKPLGNYLFDVTVLKSGLVQAERAAIRAEAQAARLHTEIVWPQFNNPVGILGRTIVELRAWFIAGLEAKAVPMFDINAFLVSPAASDREFWMAHFTAKDLTAGPAKALRVFKKWQSQNLS